MQEMNIAKVVQKLLKHRDTVDDAIPAFETLGGVRRGLACRSGGCGSALIRWTPRLKSGHVGRSPRSDHIPADRFPSRQQRPRILAAGVTPDVTCL
jgi:hypothetical protein